MSDHEQTKPRADEDALDLLRYKAVLDNARDAVISIDASGTITQFNRAAEEMFGYTSEEVLGKNIGILMPSPYREEHDQYVARYRATGEAHAIGRIRQVEALRKSGEVFPIELSVCEVRTGDEPAYTAIIRDVSAARAMLEALRRERDFSERLIDTVPLIVLLLDTDGRVVRYNRFTEQLVGYASDEVVGEDGIDRFVPERERQPVREALARTLRGEDVGGIEVTLITRGGEERIISWRAAPLLDADGATIGVLAAGEDLTERRRQQAELRRLEERTRENERLADIGAIAAKLVHDLGNPLSGLSMQVQLLLRRAEKLGPAGAELRQPAERIAAATARLNELIRSFMDFAREQRLHVTSLDLAELLQECVSLWQPVAAAAGIDLSWQTPDTVTVRADAAKLKRVFDNLIKNAIEAMENTGGTLRVTLEHVGDRFARIVVRDSGPGIPQGMDVFRLFETTKPNGTGIGLAVAKQIVVAHGGTIEVASGSDAGTEFTIDLPITGPVA